MIPRDKLLSTFGKCSAIDRTDGTSVVFKEISKDDSKDEYHKIIHLLVDDNPSKLRPVEFDLPNGYVDKKDFYKHSSRRTGYIIPYNFPLNTRRGFKVIYYLMKLSQHDMTTVIKDIIAVRHAGINFITDICDKLEKENDNILTFLYGEARM